MGAVPGEERVNRPAGGEHGDNEQDKDIDRRERVVLDVDVDQRGQHTQRRDLLRRRYFSTAISGLDEGRGRTYEGDDLENAPAGEEYFQYHLEGEGERTCMAEVKQRRCKGSEKKREGGKVARGEQRLVLLLLIGGDEEGNPRLKGNGDADLYPRASLLDWLLK